jgi:hypothetical protein
MVVAGIARLTVPDMLTSPGAAMFERPPWLVLPDAVVAALGAWFSWTGYS